jgi:periplasmic divalent cation tolerance protein
MPFLIIYVTHPSKPEAARITSELLNARLIACANYIPIESVFWWEWFLTKSDEIATLYKTRIENWEIVKLTIERTHKDKTPCIIKLSTVEANESYEKWIQEQTDPSFHVSNANQINKDNSLNTLFPSV